MKIGKVNLFLPLDAPRLKFTREGFFGVTVTSINLPRFALRGYERPLSWLR